MAEILWYYAHDQQQLGPVTSIELKRLAAAGQLFPDDLIWREGMDEWGCPAVRVKGLFSAARDAAEPGAGRSGRARSRVSTCLRAAGHAGFRCSPRQSLSGRGRAADGGGCRSARAG